MSYELSGNVKVVLEPQTFASGFIKRELVVSVQDGQYTQEICVEFVKDKVALLDSLQPGQPVSISFNIKGREYNGRYYTNLQGWKLTTDGQGQHQTNFNSSSSIPEFDDDVPF